MRNVVSLPLQREKMLAYHTLFPGLINVAHVVRIILRAKDFIQIFYSTRKSTSENLTTLTHLIRNYLTKC